MLVLTGLPEFTTAASSPPALHSSLLLENIHETFEVIFLKHKPYYDSPLLKVLLMGVMASRLELKPCDLASKKKIGVWVMPTCLASSLAVPERTTVYVHPVCLGFSPESWGTYQSLNNQ